MKRYRIISRGDGQYTTLYNSNVIFYMYHTNRYWYKGSKVDLRWYNVEKHKLKREVTNTAKLIGDL